MRRDAHNTGKYSRGLSPAAATTDNTVYTSQILDTAGFDANEFILLMGAIASGTATFAAAMTEGNQANLSDGTAVNAVDILGTLNGVVTAGVSNGFNPGFADSNTVRKIGYKGSKRYIRIAITPAGNAASVQMAGAWLQSFARTIPQNASGV